MSSWYLTFRSPTGEVTLEACQTALKAVFGTDVTTTFGETSGNPIDYYWRHIRLETRRADGGVAVSAELSETLNSPADSIKLGSVQVGEYDASWIPAAYADRLAAWHALRDAFAAIGFTDETVVDGHAWIIDDAEAAGDAALGAELRENAIKRVLASTSSPEQTSIVLSNERVDVDVVLAAVTDASRIKSVLIEYCRLTALPVGLERFQNIESLHIKEKTLDGHALRGFSFPKLTHLSFAGGVTRLTKADLAGFSALVVLGSPESMLAHLASDIIDVCPALKVCSIQDTPLSKDVQQIATLQARWPNVRWDLEW